MNLSLLTKFRKVVTMTRSTETKVESSGLFAVVVVAAVIGAWIWIPLGLIISVGTLIIAKKSRRSSSWPIRSATVLIIVTGLFTNGYAMGLFSSKPANANNGGMVQSAFQNMSVTVAKKEGVVSLELIAVHVGNASYPDGTKASLWVTNPDPLGIRSQCFYIDMPAKGGGSGQMDTACGVPGTDVSLERAGTGSSVIGFIGLWPAPTVSVTANGTTIQLPVTLGYFILPGSLSVNPAEKFTIKLMSNAGLVLGTVTDLKASGSATPK